LNAGKRTGPRSPLGKRRARHNAYRHGLAASSGPASAVQIEELARQLAGNSTDAVVLEYAREAAHARFELSRIARAKVALIQIIDINGGLDRPTVCSSIRDIRKFYDAFEHGKIWNPPELVDPAASMPVSNPEERMAEAVVARCLTWRSWPVMKREPWHEAVRPFAR
jgi:hypothetical protein